MMNPKVESIQIFAVPVFRILLEGLSDKLGLEKIVRDHVYQGKPRPRDPKLVGIPNAFQSSPSLHTEDVMQPFKEKMVEVMKDVIEQHGIDPLYEIEITSMWGNIQPKGHAFHRHSHHNNMFAAVYYVNQTELKKFPHILLWNDRSHHQLSPTRNYDHPFNRNRFPVELKKDLLVIFPAWVDHEVSVNTSSKDRISIAFNVMLRGRFAEIDSKESTIL